MEINTGSTKLPRWNFSSIEPLVHKQKHEAAAIIDTLSEILHRGEELLAGTAAERAADAAERAACIIWLEEYITENDRLTGLFDQLFSYAYCRYAVETGNSQWVKNLNSMEAMAVPQKAQESRFVRILSRIFEALGCERSKTGVGDFLRMIDKTSPLHNYAWHLEQSLEIARFRMSPELEELAGDLKRSAGDAWERLHSSMSSDMSIEWNPITHETRTMVELRNLAFNADRHTRKKAYNLELKLWKDYEIAFAAALNGVKGNSLSLYERRGYEDFLHPSIQSCRISRKTLNSLISAMEDSLPMFRRYFAAKAACLKLPRLSFYDLFAPLSGGSRSYSYGEARDIIVEQFSGFSEDMGDFAQRVFSKNWIDAEPRPGKVGGAFMTDFPIAEESRIMSNFDGSFNAVSTLAHELGHAYHSAKLEGFTYINRHYPMTLAETASTFCETIVYNSAIEQAEGAEKQALIEELLMGNAQVIVDILSRFYFEREVFIRRKDGELSPAEFCGIMLDSQKRTYGEGLNEDELHSYMWAVKGHYYSTDLAFYNYPYAFGQLFAIGLYARYTKDPRGFPSTYIRILQNTGILSAVELCAREGFNIEEPEFWQDGLRMLEPFIAELEISPARL